MDHHHLPRVDREQVVLLLQVSFRDAVVNAKVTILCALPQRNVALQNNVEEQDGG